MKIGTLNMSNYAKSFFVGIFSLLVLVSFVIPQDVQDLGKKLKEKKYHSEIKMTLFKDIKMMDTLETQNISISVFNSNLHYRLSAFEAYANANYSIVIDHSCKTILINDNSTPSAVKTKLKIDPIDFDSIFYEDYSFKVARNTPNSKTYVVSTLNENKEVDYLNFTFDPQKLIPQKVLLKYNRPLTQLLSNVHNSKQEPSSIPILLMNYDHFEYDNEQNNAEFNFDHILKINNNHQAFLTPKYKSYQIFNYLNVKK